MARRAGPVFTKKFIKNVFVVAVIVAVAYLLMRGVTEGFQSNTSEIYLQAPTTSYPIPAEHYTGKGPLKGLHIFVWGPCISTGVKPLPSGWVQLNDPANQRITGPRYASTYLRVDTGIILEMGGKKIEPPMLAAGVSNPTNLLIKGMQGTANVLMDGKCTVGDPANKNAQIKIVLKF